MIEASCENMKTSLVLLWGIAAVCKEGVEVLQSIQRYREKHSLKPLIVSKELTKTARDRTEALLRSSNLFNQKADIWTLAEENGFKPLSLGENIGKSASKEKHGADIFEEWVKSPVHKENLIDPHDYTHVGVYELVGETNTYVSAVFGREEVKPLGHAYMHGPAGSQAPSKSADQAGGKEAPKPASTLSVQSSSHMSPPPANPSPSPSLSQTSSLSQAASLIPAQLSTSSKLSSSFSSPSSSSTFLLTLPESVQKSNSVIKLVLTRDK
ncbi:hypothetical protein NECID01_0938 [Nematocida sp. AWRm77]|nr:hypothetical protein NECID01_0938 [Nematocida sp. AWRm77]